ncbi:hypothetical protein O181_026379 [Austropuccinia psidii MF-1]|uniref:Uncharacterized protein n=1 Tax=Austropuccinia psidii MF-1 TaxID=1389203 RepID=A0A9Q3CM84_9BASI|nr:hypothetical protein [Austropuccinia psidii MF-1]
MRPKGDKGEDHHPQGQVGPPEPYLAPNYIQPKMAIKEPQDPKWPNTLWKPLFQSMASAIHQRAPTQLPGRFPLTQHNGDIFRTKLSLKSITNLEGGLLSYSVWKFPGGYQKIIQGPQLPGPAEVGLSFSHQEYYKGNSQRLSIFSIIVKE